MSEENESSSDMDMVVELPPVLVQFLGVMRAEQKRLLKDKTFGNPDQLRKFVSLTLMERLCQFVEMMGTTALDTHQLAVSNATQLQRQRRWTAKHLRKLGAEVSDGEAFAGVGTEQIDVVGQALYALGSHLQAKYPNDKDTEDKFNAVMMTFNTLIEALMGDQSTDEDEEDEDEEDEENGETPDDAAPTDEAVSGDDAPSGDAGGDEP